MIIQDVDRAGQRTWMIGGSYDFAELEVPGLVLDGSVGLGSHAIDLDATVAQGCLSS